MSSNAFQVSNLVAKSMTQFFVQKSPLANTSNRDFVETFAQQGYATGGTINVKVPAYPQVQRGLAVTASGIQDLVIPYTIVENDIYSVARELSLYESRFDILGGDKALTANVKKAIVDNYAYPAYQAIEAQMEATAALRLKTTAYLSPVDGVDVLGSLNTYTGMANIEAMAEQLKLDPERYMVMNVTDATNVTTSLQNMFNAAINDNITKNARVGGPDKGRLAGMDIFRSTEFTRHIAGPLAATSGITVSSLAADGVTLTLTGVPTTAGNLVKAGDRFSIPAVNLVSEINQNLLSYRLVVVAAADANGNNDGTVTVIISYPLMASGEHINVNALPTGGDSVFVFPSHNVNFMYTKSGLAFVPLPLGDIYGAANSSTRGDDSDIPVKVTLQGQVSEFTNIFRISTLVGIRAFAPYVIAVPSIN